MKKLLLILIAVVGLTFTANAQRDGKAIGARFGGGQGYGAELSFQAGLGGPNRLEADLGYHSWGGDYSTLGLVGVYQLTFDIPAVPGLGWFAGVGGRVDLYTGGNSAAIDLGLVGQAGLDYYFSVLPLQLSLDIRPCFYLYPSTAFHWGDIALGVRYTF